MKPESDAAAAITNRTVVKRNETNQAMVDAAQVMPTSGPGSYPAAPAQTPAAQDAHGPVKGTKLAPSLLPGGRR